MKNKIIYYKDELNDDFSGSNIKPRVIDENYKYFHKNPFWFILAFFYNIIMFPIKVIYPKVKFRIKYVGKEKLKEYKSKGYFVYVNHTQVFCDTFIPSNPIWPKRNYFIVNPENVSMPIFGNSIQMLGAIPIPNNKKGMKNFLDKIKDVIKKKHSITIYPEAHIWPYYTKIRPFKAVSFKYPIELDVPVFCMTNTYIKRKTDKEDKENKKIQKDKVKKSNRVNIVTYIDGPFFPNKNLSKQEQKQDLRDRVYNKMVERSQNSNIEVIRYILKSDCN